ncbi:MAG: hypothetical protein KA368_08640, partial [Acidobacteria bacterium]|nr:hypothetical protein [Acidobacteriota bacterium]
MISKTSLSLAWRLLSMRHLLALIFALSLTFPALVSAQQNAAKQQASAKRALTHQDYDGWRSIQGQTLSRDGKFLAYAAIPQDGDGEIIVRNLATGAEFRSPRGWRPPTPPPNDPEAGPGAGFQALAGAVRPRITADSRFAIFTIEPNKAEVLKARKDKKTPEQMPKNALGIMDLTTGQVTRIERVKNFQVPEDGAKDSGSWLAYSLEAKPEEKKPEATADTPKPSNNDGEDEADVTDFQRGGQGRGAGGGRPGSGRKEYGTDLVLRNLSNNGERTFADALDYSFAKDAKTLVFTVSAKKEESNGVFVATPGNDAAPVELLSGKGKYTRLTWDEDQTQLAFFSDKDDAAAKQPKVKIYLWNRKAEKATEIVSTAAAGFRSGMVISERGGISFSQDGGELFLGVAPPPEPEKDPNVVELEEEKVVADLWHWKDDYIQPMQKVRVEQER